MMKKIKIITILSLIFLIITITTNSYALTTIISDSDQFLGKGASVEQTLGAEGSQQLKNTSNDLFKLLTAIGIVVMFIVGTIIGIQFLIASAEDKAKVKEALVPYIVGCIVIFGAFTIWSIAVKIGQNLFPTKTTAPVIDNGYGETDEYDSKGFKKNKEETQTTSPVIDNGNGATDEYDSRGFKINKEETKTTTHSSTSGKF